MVDFGELPANEIKSFPISMGVTHIHVNLGASYWVAKNVSYTMAATGCSFVHSWITYIVASPTAITIGTNYVSAADYKGLVCIEYTKNTD